MSEIGTNLRRSVPLVIAAVLAVCISASSAAPPISFVPSAVVAAGSHITHFAVADFNGDGMPDLAVASMSYHSNTLAVLLGHRTGAYTPAPGSPVKLGGRPAGVVPSDINGDGKVDLVVSQWSDDLYDNGPVGVSTILGDGQGRFRPAGRPPVEFDDPPTVSDLNADGKADLVALDNDRVAVRLGDGSGRFVPVTRSAVASGVKEALGVGVADFNGDGKPDLVVTGKSKVAILLGTGAGHLAAARAVIKKSGSLTVADFNGDGKPDVALAGKKLWILLGDGTGGFRQAPGSPLGVRFQEGNTAADLNGDGKVDLAGATESNESPATGSVRCLLGNGAGGFHRWAGSRLGRPLPFVPRALTPSDVNVDGKVDLVALAAVRRGYGEEGAEEGENRLALFLQGPSAPPSAVVRGRALPGSADVRLTTRGLITKLAADGDRVAAITTPSYDSPADRVLVWTASGGKVKTFKVMLSPHGSSPEGGLDTATVDVALGGHTAAWITSTTAGNTQGWLDLYSADLRGGPVKRLDGSDRARTDFDVDGDRWIEHLLGGGSLVAYNRWATVCDPPSDYECGPGDPWLRVQSQSLVRLVAGRRAVARRGAASYRLAAVGGGRMAVESPDRSITVLAPGGRRIASVPVVGGDLPRGIALDRTHLAVARWSRTLDLYNPATGAKQKSLPLGPAAELDLVGVNARLALLREGAQLVIVRLRDGKLISFPLPPRTAARLDDARLTDRGLFYAYDVKRSGRIVFEPTSALLRRF